MESTLSMSISLSSFLLLVIFMAPRVGGLCPESKCNGNGTSVRFPFHLQGTHLGKNCSYPGFDLSCNPKSEHPVLELPSSVKLLISKIDYKSQVLDAYDQDNCLPKQFLDINLSNSPFNFNYSFLANFSFFNCSVKDGILGSVYPFFGVPCLSGPGFRVIAYLTDTGPVDEYMDLMYCTKMYTIRSIPVDVIQEQMQNMRMSWSKPDCRSCEAHGNRCRSKTNGTKIECEIIPKKSKGLLIAMVVTGIFVGIVILSGASALFVFCKSKKRKRENEKKIKQFLEDYKALKPTRYSYTDIKQITNHFKDELGRGANGTVYRGMLSNDVTVAVKVLDDSTEKDGKDFINEVGTIGMIHHVNIVRLVGFCADGFKRALVYEFLPNGSLQKFICSSDRKQILSWDKLQEIATGIAKGIEYLHQGCEQRILHFDIKPHNILLDANFNPKICDFGMAKLCSKDKSAVTMTTARGTMGYIAPEIVSRHFGNVSYKSDVFSFGMLLLEMVGGRMTIDCTEDNSSEIHIAEKIYNLLALGENLQIYPENDDSSEIAKKLAIVGLWCIQWSPVDRPSMGVIVHMLEQDEELPMPANPFASAAPGNVTMRVPELQRIPESLLVPRE